MADEICTKSIRLFGQTATVYQVCAGKDVVKVAMSREEADAWIAAH